MTCPKCTKSIEPKADQVAAGSAATASGLFVAWGGIFGMIAAPYLMPVVLGGLLWNIVRTVACPNCGHRFNYWQAVPPSNGGDQLRWAINCGAALSLTSISVTPPSRQQP